MISKQILFREQEVPVFAILQKLSGFSRKSIHTLSLLFTLGNQPTCMTNLYIRKQAASAKNTLFKII